MTNDSKIKNSKTDRIPEQNTKNQTLHSVQSMTTIKHAHLFGTAAAIVLALSDIRDAFSTYLTILGMFMGVLAGMFLLGMFTKRCNAFGCVAAGVVTAVVMYTLKFGSTIFIFGEHNLHKIHGYLYVVVSICLCMGLGLVLSLLSGGNKKDTHGLTVFNMLSKEEIPSEAAE